MNTYNTLAIHAAAAALVFSLGCTPPDNGGGSTSTQHDIELTTTADVFISNVPGLGGVDANNGSHELIGVIGPRSGVVYDAVSLVKFDLADISDQCVSGDATVSLHLDRIWDEYPHEITVRVYQESASWEENAVTWANFEGSVDGTGAVLDTQLIEQDLAAGLGSRYISWTVPASVIQSWIDAPSSNNGFLFVADEAPAGTDTYITSKEGDNGTAEAPKLEFTVTCP